MMMRMLIFTECLPCARYRAKSLTHIILLNLCNNLAKLSTVIMLLQMRKLRPRGVNSSAQGMKLVPESGSSQLCQTLRPVLLEATACLLLALPSGHSLCLSLLWQAG